MPRASLNLQSLGELDNGLAGPIINTALAAAMQDVDDRGQDEAVRKVVITIELKKTKTGIVEVSVKAAPKLPQYQTAPTACLSVKGSDNKVGLEFHPENPDNPHQASLPFDQDKNAG